MGFNLLAAIVPAVVGGIFSSHANKKQNRANQRNAEREREVALQDDASRFTRLRDAAVAGGFNPLTALQFGGTTMGFGSGHAAQQVFDWGPTASAMMSAAIPEISGQADVARQRAVLENDLLKVQADALRTSTTATQAALNSAQAFRPVGGYSAGGSGGAAMAGAAVAAASSARPAASADRTLMFNGVPLVGDVNSATAEEAEAIAGEAGGLVFGVNQLAHMGNNYAQSLGGGGIDAAVGRYLADNFTIREGSVASWLRDRITGVDNVTVHSPPSRPWPDQVGRHFAPLWE